jgi:hypothetical protein
LHCGDSVAHAVEVAALRGCPAHSRSRSGKAYIVVPRPKLVRTKREKARQPYY